MLSMRQIKGSTVEKLKDLFPIDFCNCLSVRVVRMRDYLVKSLLRNRMQFKMLGGYRL